MKGKITISRDSHNKINISIVDVASGLTILKVEMDPGTFGEAVTGLGYSDCDITHTICKDHYWKVGKKKEMRNVLIDKPEGFSTRAAQVRKVIEESGELVDGWEIWSDGTDSQQNSKKHCVILCRYVGM